MALSNLYAWTQSAAPSACGTACGAGDKPEEVPTACGAGTGPETAPTACGSACGASNP